MTTLSTMATRELIDVDRLLDRVVHYAKAGGASEKATRQMVDMLQSAEGKAVLNLPAEELDSLLVNDVYKIRMQNMYSHYMTGVLGMFRAQLQPTLALTAATPAAHPAVPAACMILVFWIPYQNNI